MHLDPNIFNNTNYKLALVFAYSLVASFIGTLYFIRKSKQYGYVVEDKYKPGKYKIPTMGGLAMFAGVMLSLSLSVLLLFGDARIGQLFIMYFIVTVYAMYGVLDDIFHFKRRYDKIVILLILSLPIGALIAHQTIDFFGVALNIGALYAIVVAPVYIMVVANLFNVYAGFNGLSNGLGLILLLSIAIKSFLLYGSENLLFILPVFGAALAFFPFNWFPAKAHEGNSGQFLLGSAIGCLLIINKLEIFGVIILIPHIINFILDTLILTVLQVPDVKFGSVRKNGTIIAPESVRFKSLKFMLTYYFQLKEKHAVLLLYIPTIIFCILGVWLY